jgi:mRNA interferase MazF
MLNAYPADAGELVWRDHDPLRGRERGGQDPALVISPVALWHASRLVILCPVAAAVSGLATSVVLPEGLPIGGEILTSHVQCVDTLMRPIMPLRARVSEAVLAQVRGKLGALLGIG